jgi:outer membrane protein assembly factor BamE
MQKVIQTLTLGALLLALAGCSSLKFPGVYRISVQQGNIVDQDMRSKLEPGMTRRQVRFVMGSPLIEDTFNPNRWDYYYSLRTGDNELIRKHLTLTFDGDVLASIEGDMDPTTPTLSPEEIKEALENEDAAMPQEPFEAVVEE